jgi:hypothetical protein
MKAFMFVIFGSVIALVCVSIYDPWMEQYLLAPTLCLIGVEIGYLAHELETQLMKAKLNREIKRFVAQRDQEQGRKQAETRLREVN